ncbi:MAG: hypothetical protein F6K00_30955 [Leptolyngbya sp. SIOISBB]|nr:hypothetical protein [Leptolyngbya sp. SIOISBB]
MARSPEDGLVVNINTDLADITEFIAGSNFVPPSFGGDVLGAIYNDSGTATGLQLRLESQNAVINFPGVGLAATDPQTVNFFVEAGEGYTAAADIAAITVYDTLDQVPAATSIPEVSMSLADSGPFVEGSDTVTVNFALAGDIPAAGVLVYVSNNAFAGLVDFDLLNAQVTGGSFPAPDGNAGGFYFKITEPTASITLDVRADEAVEGLEQVPLALQALPGYTIAEGAGEISVLLQDDASSILQVSVEASSDVLVETAGTAAVHTFNLSAPPADGQLTVTVEAPGLTELDLLDLQVENGGISAIRPGGFDLVILGQSATVTLPVVDDGVSEGLEEISFSVAAGDGYQVDPEAGSASFQIVDTVKQIPATDAESNDTIATAISTGLGPDNRSVSIDGAISFSFRNREVDQTEDVDMYSFVMAAGDTIRIDADADVFDSGLDPILRVFDAHGEQLAQSDDNFAPDELFAPGGLDSYIEFTATDAGTYYVGISSFGNGFFDFFLDDDGNPTNAPYDPNVAGSGTGRSFGDYTLNLKLNEEFVAEATDIPASTGAGPTVSLSASPATYDSDDNLTASALVQFVEDGASILTVGLTTEGDIPADGLEVFLTSSLDLSTAFDTGAPFSPGGAEVLGAVFDDAGTPIGLRINLTSNTAVLNLNLDSPDEAPTDGVETVTFTLEPSAGYQVSNDSTFSTEIYDTLADVPVMPNVPTVGVAISETALVESAGNLTTLTFTLDGPPPAEGVLINMDSGVRAALGEFDVFNAEITGGDFPSPNFQASGFFFRITEQTATITLAAFDETTNDQIPAEDALEGIEEFTFTVQPGVGYAIAPDASAVTVTIADNPDSVPLPGDDGDDSGDGDEMPPMEMELNDTIADANVIERPLDGSTIVIEGEIGTTRATRNLIDRSEDIDMYAFDLEAGQTLILDVDGGGTGDAGVAGSLLDNILRIFDATGNELAIVDNAGAPDEVFQANGDTYIEFTAPATGTYYAGISNLGNNSYDPNVAGSGSGWTFNDRFEPGEYRLEATLATTPTLPTVSVSLPEVVSEADDAPILTAVFAVAGEIPADGLVVAIGGDAGFLLDPANRITDNNRFFEIVPEGGITADGFGPNGELLVRLFASEVSFRLPIFDDILEEPDTDYTFTLLEGDGYLVDPDSALQTVTFTDGVPGGVGPTVSLSVSETDVAEGDEFTVNFDVEGDIPDGGLTVFVDGPAASLSEFNIFGDDGIDPDTDIVGLAGLPEPDNDAGGFFATITENQASIKLSVFDDGPTEGPESFTFELLDGEQYEVSSVVTYDF